MKKLFLLIGLVVLGGVAWYALSPLFMNKTVDDTLPVTEEVGSSELVMIPKIPSEPREGVQQPVIPTVLSEPVPIVDTPIHPASGVVRIVKTGDATVVRYENYKTINGPDVRVYLANDLKATDYVDLGPIKGTEGNINYSVPAGVNIDDYRYVLTWCEDFSVLFNSADLATLRK